MMMQEHSNTELGEGANCSANSNGQHDRGAGRDGGRDAGHELVARSVVESLQKHRVRQMEAQQEVGSAYATYYLVFADALGEPLHPNTVRLWFLRLIREAGVAVIRFHDLRHTSATLIA